MTSSFRKAAKSKAPDIVGTRISAENSQFLVSTGAPAFDSVIGGGLAVGTILLVEEDPSGSYAKLMAKLFLAEGLVVGHPLFFASKDLDPAQMMSELPPPVSSSAAEDTTKTKAPQDADLKIAWRYQHLPSGQEAVSTPLQFGHHFDLSQKLGSDAAETVNATLWSGSQTEEEEHSHKPENVPCASLLTEIQHCLTKQNCWVNTPGGDTTSAAPARRTVLRLVLHSLGSPFWDLREGSLPTFMFALRALLRAACAVCLITVPTQCLTGVGEAVRCRQLSDYCIQPSPAHYVDGKVAPLLSGMDGVFKILRLPVINSLTPFRPESLDLGFKVRRKKFTIEKLQLPPELEESVEREQDDVGVPTGSLGCGSTASKLIEF